MTDGSPKGRDDGVRRWLDSRQPGLGGHAGPTGAGLAGIHIAGDRERVIDWLGLPPDQAKHELTEVEFTFVAPHGTPGLLSCRFTTATGDVTVEDSPPTANTSA